VVTARLPEETVRGQLRKEQIETEGAADDRGNRRPPFACTRRPARNLLERADACVPASPNCRTHANQPARPPPRRTQAATMRVTRAPQLNPSPDYRTEPVS